MPGKILIVDDDADDVMLLSEDLRRHGYTVEFVTNPEEALARARSFRPDLVVLDILLPRIDGTEICRHLRADESFRGIPVLFLTSLKSHLDADGPTEGDPVFAKPVNRHDVEALRNAIRKLISGAPA